MNTPVAEAYESSTSHAGVDYSQMLDGNRNYKLPQIQSQHQLPNIHPMDDNCNSDLDFTRQSPFNKLKTNSH